MPFFPIMDLTLLAAITRSMAAGALVADADHLTGRARIQSVELIEPRGIHNPL